MARHRAVARSEGRWRGVSRLPAAQAAIESGSWDAVLEHGDVALIAHFSRSAQASRSLEALLAALHDVGFGTAVISTSEVSEPLQFSGDVQPGLVVRRPNVGYDFGSWSWAITSQPEVCRRRTLLMNDSLAGPFAPTDVFQKFLWSTTDVWGLVGSGQYEWHLQSYCVGYAPGVLADGAVQQFWRSVAPQPTKTDVILAYELGQTRTVLREGFTIDVVVPPGLLIDRELNPAILAWRQLLDTGIPMVKKELIRDPSVAPDAAEIPAELRDRYGVEVEEWL